MSRIGKSALAVPTGVEVTIAGAAVTVKGPKGTLKRELPVGVSARREENNLFVERANDERDSRSRHGLARTLLSNMIIGVTDGYSKALDIQGVGYRAEAQGPNKLKLALGYSHPIVYTAPEGVTFEVTAQTQIVIKGSDKETVGQVAANIRNMRKPEPYKGKGVRYLNERVRRKAGKTGKK
ncbi:MAG: 50S ribosomal protein L6 [Actinobacteria bacterium]|jgi:large subunit ribosomal protein L6|nr:50S ribosomal protein L6 [Actinomycetota bacterium]NCU81336.1 50S ribosomal protein L6 [Acidimicrobiia bacterium]NDC99847.1 50S ribosomal protein L6 [bacterium]HBQ51979.1 50S ribosomal protein L6 [Acidimicrobium sp.]NBQ45088.1 50S ribosomal protein L6 [Actinomycetota bacterium]